MGSSPGFLSFRHEIVVFDCGSACYYFASETGGFEEVEEGGFGESVGCGAEGGEKYPFLPECGECFCCFFTLV